MEVLKIGHKKIRPVERILNSAVWTGTKPVKTNLLIDSGSIFYIIGLFFLSTSGGQNCPPLVWTNDLTQPSGELLEEFVIS